MTRPTAALRQAAHGAVEALENRVLLTASLPTTVHHSANAAYTLTGNAGAYTLTLTAGSWTFDADLSTQGADWQNLSLQLGTGTQAAFNSPETLAGLQLGAAAKVAVSQGTGGLNGNLLTLATAGLSLDPASTLDLTDNNMILQNAGTAGSAQIQSLLHTAYHNGDWQGPGLTSSTAAAAATTSSPTAIGYALVSAIKYGIAGTPFEYLNVGSNDVVLDYTVVGDVTFDGFTNSADSFIYKRNMNHTGTTWEQADFNYDGVTDSNDSALLFRGLTAHSPNQVPRTLNPTGLTILPIEGQDFTGKVSTFTDTNTPTTAADYTASIEWGDGIFHPATVTANANGGFDITGTSPYSLTNPDVLVLALVKYSPTSAYAGRPAALSEPIQIMPAVSDLAATATGAGEIDLSWTLNASNASAIEVDRSPDGVIFTPVTTTLAGSATGYHDTSSTLTEDTHYYYEVRAIQPGGASIFSNVADAFTLAAAPTDLQAAANGTTEVDLSWTNNSSSSAAFFIERSDDGGNTFSIIDATAAGAVTYHDTSVGDGTSYLYQVDAVSGDGIGMNPSNTTNAIDVPLTAPTQLSAVANGASEIDLSWTNTSQTATGYSIERSTDPANGFSPVATISYADTTSFSDSGLQPATRYYYRVLATASGLADSSASNVANAPTGPSLSISGDPTVQNGTVYVLSRSVTLATGLTDPITGWNIDWGDGNTSTPTGDPATFQHTYGGPGSYVVAATASTASDTLHCDSTVNVTVAVPQPQLSFADAYPAPVAEGATVTLNPVYVADGAGAVNGYLVDWGDGSQPQSYAANATAFTHAYAHGGDNSSPAYPSPKSYPVSVSAVTAFGMVSAAAQVKVTGNNRIDPGAPLYGAGMRFLDVTSGLGPIDYTLNATESDTVSLTPTCAINDPNATSDVTYTVDWGDGPNSASTGTIPRSNGSSGVTMVPVTHVYSRDGDYLVTIAAGSTTETRWVDVSVPTPYVTPPAEQVTGAGQAFTCIATYNGGAAGANPVAFVDLHDGTGPHQQAVSGGTSGTITIAFAKAPAPGVYHPTIVLSDTVGGCPTGGGDFTLDVWGVKINNGESNDVLIASPDGTQNLQPVTLYFPHPAGEALDLILTTTDATEANLWSGNSPSGSQTPLIGNATPSFSFSVAPDDPQSKIYWVGATKGDATPNVLRYELSGHANDSQSTPAFEQQETSGQLGATGATGASGNAVSLFGVTAKLNTDPNTDPTADGSAAHPYNWLVGQIADLTATVTGPAQFAKKVIYTWDVPGTILGDYIDQKISAKTVDAETVGFATANNANTTTIPFKFFWVSTQYDPGKVAGPDHNTLQISVISWADEKKVAAAALNFNLYSPIARDTKGASGATVVPGKVSLAASDAPEARPPLPNVNNGNNSVTGQVYNLGLNGDPNNANMWPDVGITFGAGVSTPQPAGGGANVFAPGAFRFTQLITPSNTFTVARALAKSKIFGKQGLDDVEAYPAGGGPPQGANGLFTATPFDPILQDKWKTDDGVKFANDGPGLQPVEDDLITLPGHGPQDLGWKDIADNMSAAAFEESFQTYLMYKPPGGSLAEWVPLLVLNWSFTASGSRKVPPPPKNVGGYFKAGAVNNPWTFLGGNTAIPAAFDRATVEPEWIVNVAKADTGP